MSIRRTDRRAFLLADLGFGDQTKGANTDYIARAYNAHTVIRYNGGGQAGHNVVTPDGRHHTFSQFGAGTFIPGVATHLSRHMVLNPWSMVVEARHLKNKGVADAFARTTISAQALVVAPFQGAANRVRERARGDHRHGSCGMGIGETVADSLKLGTWAIRAGDLRDIPKLRRRMEQLQAWKRDQLEAEIDYCRMMQDGQDDIEILNDPAYIQIFLDSLLHFLVQANIVDDSHLGEILQRPGSVIFEGAQGVLLDEWRGFHPYTTWSTCTLDNALTLLKEHSYQGETTRVGIVRAYATRHGAGPFVTEDAELAAAIPDPHNKLDDWQRSFRIGWFDLVATRYAIEACNGIDVLSVNCLDRLESIPEWKVCEAYHLQDRDLIGRTFVMDPRDARKADGIRLNRNLRDLEHQETLTQRLLTAKPIYQTSTPHARGTAVPFEQRVASHLSHLSDALRVPVWIASYGPTATEKREFKI